jgi:hypothetical protein
MARPAPTPLDSGLLIAKSAPPSAPTPATGESVEPTAPGPIQAPATLAAVTPRRSVLEPKVKPVRVPLTVKIRPETLRRLRLVAVHHEIEQQDIVEEALAQWLDFNEPK